MDARRRRSKRPKAPVTRASTLAMPAGSISGTASTEALTPKFASSASWESAANR